MGVLLVNAVVVVAVMVALWALSTRTRDPSFVDVWWGLGFVLVAALTASLTHGAPARKAALVLLTGVWGCRLAGYLFWRWRTYGPDARYQAMIRHAGDDADRFVLTHVFLLQAGLMWVVSLPLQLGQLYRTPSHLTFFNVVGVLLVLFGVAFEATGDAQLTRFKRDPANEGTVMDRGLWRYTRHPNYFGDTCVWWGLFLVSITNGVTLLGVVGPVVMTGLLLRYSGAALLERRLTRSKPGYEDYIARTSSFVPRRPRSARIDDQETA